jgi:hypothetical protein
VIWSPPEGSHRPEERHLLQRHGVKRWPPEIFGNTCGCACAGTPPGQYYYSYPPRAQYGYYRRKHIVNCWGCVDLDLPETLVATVSKLVAGCTCQPEQSYALRWVDSITLLQAGGASHTISTSGGIWVSDEIVSSCTAYFGFDPTRECKYWYIGRYILFPATPTCNGSQPSPIPNSCSFGFWSRLNIVFGVDPACSVTTEVGNGPTLSSCSPLSLYWDFYNHRDVPDGGPFGLRPCSTGCSAVTRNWRVTVTE